MRGYESLEARAKAEVEEAYSFTNDPKGELTTFLEHKHKMDADGWVFFFNVCGAYAAPMRMCAVIWANGNSCVYEEAN